VPTISPQRWDEGDLARRVCAALDIAARAVGSITGLPEKANKEASILGKLSEKHRRDRHAASLCRVDPTAG
jgi:hypothetical protein